MPGFDGEITDDMVVPGESRIYFYGVPPLLMEHHVAPIMARVNTITGLRLDIKPWDHIATDDERSVRIERNNRGFWTGKPFVHVPTAGEHRLLFERINGLPIDNGFKQCDGSVQHDVLDFGGLAPGNLVTTLATSNRPQIASSASSSTADAPAPNAAAARCLAIPADFAL